MIRNTEPNRSWAPTPEQLALEGAFVHVFIQHFYRRLQAKFGVDQMLRNRKALQKITDKLAANLSSWAREVVTKRAQ